ncbi:MAG TPA: YidB family protein [Casimicrobiaceae bacterium]|nr:YidB family protein [Casimicrobiaceae bacterium]
MGLLDGLLGRVLQGTGMDANADGANPLMHLALLVLQQNGGIQGVLAKLQQAGYGATGQSWIGTGPNQPIDADALTQALGHGQLGALAQSLGLAPQEAIGGLAQVLPHVVDHMTPAGQVPGNATDMIAQALSALQHRAS